MSNDLRNNKRHIHWEKLRIREELPGILTPIALLILLDQLTKFFARRNLRLSGEVPVIRGVLSLLYVENRGAAFGILQNSQWFFIVTALVIIICAFAVLFLLTPSEKFFPIRVCLITLIAGALGNLIDRIVFGYVTDFIYFSLIDFPVFNLADICVTCSIALIVILTLFYYKDADYEELKRLLTED